MTEERSGFVFCCLSEYQQKRLEKTSDHMDAQFVCQAQENLTKEKNGYRCNKCGRFHPYVQLLYRDASEDARKYAKLPGKKNKYKNERCSEGQLSTEHRALRGCNKNFREKTTSLGFLFCNRTFVRYRKTSYNDGTNQHCRRLFL